MKTPKQLEPIYPISIKDDTGKKWTVGSTLNTREEIFKNIVKFKRNLKTAFAV